MIRASAIAAVACTFLVGLATGSSANAATSDGAFFPCSDNFAAQVAIQSGFVEAANEATEDHYSNRAYWDAAQTVCADFDGDGSDEMVTSLSSMGGTDPWAFFDIPHGRASEAIFSFPTIEFSRLYPNHGLELTRFGGLPAIRDTSEVFRRSDAHCCPTGGKSIRYLGFIEGHYGVLETEFLRPPGLHPTRLSASTARLGVSNFLGRRYGESWYSRNGGRLNCNRRTALNVRRCEVAFQIGDAFWFGTVSIAVFERTPYPRYARIHFGINRLNEYCAAVLHGSRRQCVRHEAGSSRFKF